MVQALDESLWVLHHHEAKSPGASWPMLTSLQGWARTRPVEPLQEVLSTVWGKQYSPSSHGPQGRGQYACGSSEWLFSRGDFGGHADAARRTHFCERPASTERMKLPCFLGDYFYLEKEEPHLIRLCPCQRVNCNLWIFYLFWAMLRESFNYYLQICHCCQQ